MDTSHSILHLGADLHVRTSGSPHKPTLVLLHGGLGSMEDFAPLLPRLQQAFRVIALDSRGHGCSTLGDAPLSYAQLAEDARHVLQTLGVARCTVMGFSDGGIAAYRLAARHPDRVERLVTIGAHWHSRQLAAIRPLYEALDEAFAREHMPTQVAAYLAKNPAPDLPRLLAELKRMWLDESASGYPDALIARIRAPLLSLRGEDDFLLSLPDWAALKTALPGAHLMQVPFAAHEAVAEQPDMVWAALQAFIAAC
ncbi:MAG: alpha/beta hydrolase [Pseudomonadota bacterium]|nr:alpha/beta hydrolase [Pseudomonadota bacterium]